MKTFARKTGFGNGHRWEIGIGNNVFFPTRGIRLSRNAVGWWSPRIVRYPGVTHISALSLIFTVLYHDAAR